MARNRIYWRYAILLILSVCCMVAAWILFVNATRASTPAQVLHRAEEALQQSSIRVEQLLASTTLIRHLASDQLTEQEERYLNTLPFHLYSGDSNGLFFWNTNLTGDIASLEAAPFGIHGAQLYHYSGVLYKQPLAVGDTTGYLAAFIPIAVTYPYENEYIPSELTAVPGSSAGRIILNSKDIQQGEDLWPLRRSADASPVLWLSDLQPADSARPVMIPILTSMSVLLLLFWAMLSGSALALRRKRLEGLALLLAAVVAGWWIIFKIRPFGLDDWLLFTPQWYAGGPFFASLGAVLYPLLAGMFGLAFFHNSRLAYATFSKSRAHGPRLVRSIAAAVAMAGLYICFALLFKSLINDSTDRFDPARLIVLNAPSAAILGALSLLLFTMGSGIFLFQWMAGFGVRKEPGYLILTYLLSLVLVCAALLKFDREPLLAVFYGLGMLGLFLTRRINPRDTRLNIGIVLWMAVLAGMASVSLLQENRFRRATRRQAIATRLATQRDDLLEWQLQQPAARTLKADDSLQNFLANPDPARREAVNRRLQSRYFTSNFLNYNIGIYLFAADSTPLYNRDLISVQDLDQRISSASPTDVPGLYYGDADNDSRTYVMAQPIVDESGTTLGLLYLDLSRKKAVAGAVYPELLLPVQLQQTEEARNYLYAIYQDGKLVSRSQGYPFPVFLSSAWQESKLRGTRMPADKVMYRYEPTPGRTVLMVTDRTSLLEQLTLFSYLFGMLLSVLLLVLFHDVLARLLAGRLRIRRTFMLPLKSRIQLSMLTIVLFSFIGIGVATVSFLKSRYRTAAASRMLSVLVTVEGRIRLYLAENPGPIGPELGRVDKLQNVLLRYSNLFGIDINLYGPTGGLAATSQEAVYDSHILSPLISPTVYTHDWTQGQSFLLQEERLGELHYTSAYLPLRNEQDGHVLGYLNIPFFNAQKELDSQIINVVVMLVNLFALLFLFSGILSISLSRWMTRSLELVSNRLRSVDMNRKNELLEWPYDDDIGELIRQYNQMVKSLEDSARRLEAASREAAWREMAQQIAHEVKNPLTPMKLSVQYLQNAIRQHRPDLPELTGKTAQALLDQIDHLAHIASAFSAFARMPQARVEPLFLNETLRTATQLYTVTDGLDFHLHLPEEPLWVMADPSWLQSILTNLLENAVQALAHQQYARIDLHLYRRDSQAIVAVTDNGPGISLEAQARIFQPYFTTKSSGTGLGLAMSRRMAIGLHGNLEFQSQPGSGTTFFLNLPVLEQPAIQKTDSIRALQ